MDTDAPAGSLEAMEAQPTAYTKGVDTMTPTDTGKAAAATTIAATEAGENAPPKQSVVASFTRSMKNVALHAPWVLLVLLGSVFVFTYLIWTAADRDGAPMYYNRRVWDQWIIIVVADLYVVTAFLLTKTVSLPYNPAFHGFMTTVAWIYGTQLGEEVIDTLDYTDKGGLYSYSRVGLTGWICVFAGLLIIMFLNVTPSMVDPASKAKKEDHIPTHNN